MSHLKSALTISFILLAIVLRVHAEDSEKNDMMQWRDDRIQMHEIQQEQRIQFRDDAKEQVQEFHQERASEAAEMRQEFQDEMEDATNAAERRMILKDAQKARKEFRESTSSSRRSLWNKIRGDRSELVDEQKQERISLFEQLRSILLFWRTN